MKQQILDALKTKFTGVNANILDRIATQLAKTVTTEDQVATAVEGVTKGFIEVIESYGDSRATDATKSAVLNYEEKYNLKDGKKVKQAKTTEPDEPKKDDDTPAWAKAIIESNKSLSERLDRLDGERIAKSRKTELDDILTKLPASLRKGYSRTPLDGSEEEWTERRNEIAEEVAQISKETGAKGAVFGRPTNNGVRSGKGSSTQEASDAEAAAVVDKLNIV